MRIYKEVEIDLYDLIDDIISAMNDNTNFREAILEEFKEEVKPVEEISVHKLIDTLKNLKREDYLQFERALEEIEGLKDE